MEVDGYDEFGFPEETAREWGMPRTGQRAVPGAGHAVQSDQPLALASLIRAFASGRP